MLRARKAFLHALEVCERQLGIDRFDVAHGIDGPFHVYDVGILETAHDMDDGVHLAYVRKELVSQALAVARALDQPRYVHELHDGVRDLFGVVHLAEHFQTLVGHGDHAHVGLDRAERVVAGFGARFGYRVEQCGLAHVGQSHYT